MVELFVWLMVGVILGEVAIVVAEIVAGMRRKRR
jgi:hypothetical protein